MYKDPRSQFGEISHQATVVIQCRQDKRDIVDRMKIDGGKGKDKSDYHIYHAKATLDSGICRIDRGDLVFQVGTSSIPRGNIMNNAPPVASFLNGLAVRKSGTEGDLSDRQLSEKLSQGIRFMGVSLGATEPNPEGGEEQQKMQITVRTQGTMSIFNNGKQNISPGDTLLWKIPTPQELEQIKSKHDVQGRYGRAPRKVTLMIEPMRAASYETSFQPVFSALGKEAHKKAVVTVADEFAHDLKKLISYILFLTQNPDDRKSINGEKPALDFDDIWAMLHTVDDINEIGGGDKNSSVAEGIARFFETATSDNMFGALITNALTGFLKIQSDIDRRKVGKALSYSKTGQKVDVLLGCS